MCGFIIFVRFIRSKWMLVLLFCGGINHLLRPYDTL